MISSSGRSQSSRTSARRNDSSYSAPSKGRPSAFRTALRAPSQPTSQGRPDLRRPPLGVGQASPTRPSRPGESPSELGPPLDLDPVPFEPVDQDALGLALGQDEQERIGRLQPFEVEGDVGDPPAVGEGARPRGPSGPGRGPRRRRRCPRRPPASGPGCPSARDWSVGPGLASTIRQGTPCLASSQAIVRPTGPAPTTRTSADSSDRSHRKPPL